MATSDELGLNRGQPHRANGGAFFAAVHYCKSRFFARGAARSSSLIWASHAAPGRCLGRRTAAADDSRPAFPTAWRGSAAPSRPVAGMAFIAAVWALVATGLIWLFWPVHSS